MSPQRAAPLSEQDGIPYGELYRLIVAGGSACPQGGGRALEATPLRWDRHELVTMFKRLGSVPPRHKPEQAALRVLLAANEMAQANEVPIEEVYAALNAFCDPESETAPCSAVPRCGECPLRPYCAHPTHRPSIKELPESERPRERLLALGERSMSDAELLAILIRGGSQEESALALAQRLLATFGSLRRIAEAGDKEMEAIKGIGKAKVAQIRAAFALGQRLSTESIPPRVAVTGSEQTFRHFHERMKGLKKEKFYCLLLDTKHNVIREDEVAVGSLNESVVHPREVFKSAVTESAAAVIFVHNHPSGSPEPSAQDVQLTRRLCGAGNLLGIRVLDHVIIGRDSYYSFAERGMLGS